MSTTYHNSEMKREKAIAQLYRYIYIYTSVCTPRESGPTERDDIVKYLRKNKN